MKRYLTYDEFYNRLVKLPDNENVWRLKCESKQDDGDYVLTFSKHRYEAEDGQTYPFIVYSYPRTLDAGLIQQDIDYGWETGINDVWNDITETNELKPYEDD